MRSKRTAIIIIKLKTKIGGPNISTPLNINKIIIIKVTTNPASISNIGNDNRKTKTFSTVNTISWTLLSEL